MKIALKITSQRSTQYANMTTALALPELLASPLHNSISEVHPAELAGQRYLLTTLNDNTPLSLPQREILARLGAVSEAHEYFERIGDLPGPFLRPLDLPFVPFVPLEMAETRRYKGKTNETFTSVLLNLAIFGGQFAGQFTERLRIFDPLAGGGTTLFLALASGYDAFGVEFERQDVETTAVFVRQYLANERIPFKEIDERGRKAGRRFQFEIGPRGETRHLVLANGDTREAVKHMREVAGGPHMHAIVGDLPYGIQHFGQVIDLLSSALPVWESMLLPGGTLALAWNATRIDRASMVALFARYTQLQVRDEPPYTQVSHTVDRVIKQRDVVVAVRAI